MNTLVADPLILSADFDAASQAIFEEQRQKHFPEQHNIVAAHLTVFHRLPGQQLTRVQRELDALAQAMTAIPFNADALRFLGNGVAYEIKAPELLAVRQRLADIWHDWLIPQDLQTFHPHVTIQNKVASHQAKKLFEELSAAKPRIKGTINGLSLWCYRKGPWEPISQHTFEKTYARNVHVS